MYKRFFNKYLNLSDDFFFVSLNEMRPFDENFFWNFFNKLFFLNYWNFFNFFIVFMSNNYFVTYLCQLYEFDFRHSNLYRNLFNNINNLVLLNNVGDWFLNFDIFWLCNYYWNLNLNLFNNLSSFVNVVRYFHYFLNFRILYFRHLNYLFYLFQVSHFDNALNRDFPYNLFPFINWYTFFTNHLNFS